MNLSVMLDGGQVYVCLTYRKFYHTVRYTYVGHLNTKMLIDKGTNLMQQL